MERIVIEIVGDTTKLQSTIDQLQKLGQVDNQNAKTFQSNNKKTNQAINQTTKDVGYLNQSIQNLGATIAGAFAVGALVQFGSESLKVSAKIDSVGKSLEYIVGGARRAGENLEWLRKLTDKLGLEFVSTASSFKLFAGSAIQSGLTLKNTQEIFESVSKAVVTMGLSAEDANGVFLALSQIMSKGTVSAEELRGQIGERIPGAFAIAAKSIGVTEQQLNKMLEQGQVLSKDFLPKFAKQLETDLGGGAEKAADGMQANLNRLTNMWTDFKNFFGANIIYPLVAGMKGVFVDTPKMLLDDLSRIFKKKSVFEAIPELGAQLQAVQDNFTRLEVRIANAKTRKELEALGNTTNKYFNTLDKGLSEAANGRYLSVMDQLADKYNSLSKAQASGVSSTEKATKAKKEEAAVIEKLPTAYERLVQKSSELESKLRDVYASGQMANTPLEIKLRTILNEIDLINTKVEQAKNGLQQMQTTTGSEKGGTAKTYTSAITAFGSVEENKLATDDIIKNAEDANKEFARLEEERTNKFREEQAKRRQLEMAAVDASIQIITMGIDFAYQSKQAEYDYEMSLLDAAYNNKKISEEDYQKRRKEILNQQANAEKEAALFQATIQTASAVISAFADGGPVLAALAALTGAAQIALIAATPVPKYFEGTESLKLNGAPRGKDTILMYGNEGEAIIPTDENKKYPGLAKAWIDGKLDEYVMSNFMLPMINPKSYELEQQKSFAENVANSIVLNQDFGTIESKLKRLDETEKAVGNKIVSAIKQQKEKIW